VIQNRGRNITSVGRGPLGLNRFEREKNRTEPNQNYLVWTGFRFGSVQKIKKIIIRCGCLFWFKTGPNRKCSALRSSIETKLVEVYKTWDCVGVVVTDKYYWFGQLLCTSHDHVYYSKPPYRLSGNARFIDLLERRSIYSSHFLFYVINWVISIQNFKKSTNWHRSKKFWQDNAV
jgi:hypothetical protein